MDDPTQQNVPGPPGVEAALAPTVVSHCTTLNEARMVVSLLASFGIQAMIDSENYYRMLGGMAQGFGGIRVHVRQVDAEAALEILGQAPEGVPIERLP